MSKKLSFLSEIVAKQKQELSGVESYLAKFQIFHFNPEGFHAYIQVFITYKCYQFRTLRNLRIDIKDRSEEHSQSIEIDIHDCTQR